MTSHRDGYSVFVSWIKVILPTAALAVLSTIFMFSGQVDVTQSLPYAELNVDEIIREQRISAPLMSGVTEDGTAVTLAAAYAVPDKTNPDRMQASQLDAEFEGQDDNDLRISALEGVIDDAGQTAVFSGGVRLATSSGIDMVTETLRADVPKGVVESDGAVIAEGPFGRVEAGKMVLERSDKGAHLVFSDNLRMIYIPQP